MSIERRMTDTVFWATVQGVGTVVAAVAAVIARVIAAGQLRQLSASNRLLAESNIALTRPYVVVDYEFRPSALRGGGTGGTSVFMTVRNGWASTSMRSLTRSGIWREPSAGNSRQ
jgi:hypothetical protein